MVGGNGNLLWNLSIWYLANLSRGLPEMHEATQRTFELARNRGHYFVLVQTGLLIPADLEWLLLDIPEACLQAR